MKFFSLVLPIHCQVRGGHRSLMRLTPTCTNPRRDGSSSHNSAFGNWTDVPQPRHVHSCSLMGKNLQWEQWLPPELLTRWWWMPWTQGRGPGGFSPGAGGWQRLHQSQRARPDPVSQHLQDVYTVGKKSGCYYPATPGPQLWFLQGLIKATHCPLSLPLPSSSFSHSSSHISLAGQNRMSLETDT